MEKKSVAKNSLFNVFYKGVTTIFPLITTAYVSRALLPTGVGTVTYAITIVTYFTLIASLGIPNYGIKAIAQNADSLEKRSKAFIELFTINLISSLICIIAYYCFVNSFPYYADRRILFNIVGIRLLLNILNVDWFYQGIEEYKLISFRGVTVRVISFLLMVAFVHSPDDYLKYALILCLGTAGNNVYNGILLRKYIKLDRYQLDIMQHMNPVIVLLASTIATEVYTMLDTVMLEYYHGAASVGYYSNAVKIVRTVYNMTIAIATPFYPRISWYIRNKEYENSNRLLNEGAKIIYLIACPAAVGLIIMSSDIVPILYGKSFMPTADVMKILGVLIVVFSTAYLFGHIILMAASCERQILIATLSGAATNCILNLILIPGLKETGAAVASVCAETVVTTVLIIHASKYFKINLSTGFSISIISAIVVMTILIMVEKTVLASSTAHTVLIILSAVVSYFAVLLVTKNDTLLKIVYRVIKQ